MNNNSDTSYGSLFPEENSTLKVNMVDNAIPVEGEENSQVEESTVSEESIVGINDVPIQNTTFNQGNIVNSIDPINRDYIDEKGNDASLSIEPANSYNANLRKEENYKLSEAMRPSKNPFVRKRTRELKGVFGTDIGFKSNGFAGIISLAGLLTLGTLVILYFSLRY